MGLDLWFREDVARILAALSAAGDGRGPEYQKALADVALAFGAAAPVGNGRGTVRVLEPTAWQRGEVIVYDDKRQ